MGDRISLDFGEVRYDQTVTLPIKVTNTGSVLAQFRLVPKLEEVSNSCLFSFFNFLSQYHLLIFVSRNLYANRG